MRQNLLIALVVIFCAVLASVEGQQPRGRATQTRKPGQQKSKQPPPAPVPSPTPSPVPTAIPTPTPIAPGDLDANFGKDGMVLWTAPSR